MAEFGFIYAETPGPTPSSIAKSKELPALKLIDVPILIHLFNYFLACVATSYVTPVLSHFFHKLFLSFQF